MRKLFQQWGRCNRCPWPNRVLLPQGAALVVLKVVKFIRVCAHTVCRIKKLKWWSKLFFFIPRLPQQASYLVNPVWTLGDLKSSLEGKQVIKHHAGETCPVSRLSLSTYSDWQKKDKIWSMISPLHIPNKFLFLSVLNSRNISIKFVHYYTFSPVCQVQESNWTHLPSPRQGSPVLAAGLVDPLTVHKDTLDWCHDFQIRGASGYENQTDLWQIFLLNIQLESCFQAQPFISDTGQHSKLRSGSSPQLHAEQSAADEGYLRLLWKRSICR